MIKQLGKRNFDGEYSAENPISLKPDQIAVVAAGSVASLDSKFGQSVIILDQANTAGGIMMKTQIST